MPNYTGRQRTLSDVEIVELYRQVSMRKQLGLPQDAVELLCWSSFVQQESQFASAAKEAPANVNQSL
jgi:hypothetical protein